MRLLTKIPSEIGAKLDVSVGALEVTGLRVEVGEIVGVSEEEDVGTKLDEIVGASEIFDVGVEPDELVGISEEANVGVELRIVAGTSEVVEVGPGVGELEETILDRKLAWNLGITDFAELG